MRDDLFPWRKHHGNTVIGEMDSGFSAADEETRLKQSSSVCKYRGPR